MDANKMICTMTLGEFADAMREIMSTQDQPKKGKEYVYKIKGVAELLGCSSVTASKLINGKLKPAVMRSGRMLVVDKELALQLFNEQ